jgi:hypothetical protein
VVLFTWYRNVPSPPQPALVQVQVGVVSLVVAEPEIAGGQGRAVSIVVVPLPEVDQLPD